MAKRDYYKVLDVPKTATEAEIKKAYRRLAMKYHPDRNPNDREAEESFKEAKEASEVLTDPHKRAAYDQYGHAGVEAAARGGGGRGGFGADTFSDIFGDVFGDIFGGGRRGGRSQVFRGADLRYELRARAARRRCSATRSRSTWRRLAECEICHGSGRRQGQHARPPATPAAAPARCASPRASSSCSRPVRAAAAAGTVVRNPCDNCLGQGRVRRTRKLSVKVPAGVDIGRSRATDGRGRGGPQRRTARGPVRRDPRARAPDLRARRRAPELRGAGELRHRRPRRQRRACRRSTAMCS